MRSDFNLDSVMPGSIGLVLSQNEISTAYRKLMNYYLLPGKKALLFITWEKSSI
jgi:hypothetical protein